MQVPPRAVAGPYVVAVGDSFDDFRDVARRLLGHDVGPETVRLLSGEETQSSLLDVPLQLGDKVGRIDVPRPFLESARWAAMHRDAQRWDLLYRFVWRYAHGERTLLDNVLDEDVRRLNALVREVKHDLHKGEAFVRFREVHREGAPHFVAWHRSDHRILSPLAEFFVRRLPGMTWSLLTPEGSAHWDGTALSFGPPVSREEAPEGDTLEALWREYYASTFNPARANEKRLRQEMPARYWSTLPEASLIPGLLHGAGARTRAMTSPAREASASELYLPEHRTLEAMRQSIKGCRGCALHEPATQAVFGEGPAPAPLMLVGEQPGDKEDLSGRPFVGPAGQLLDELLREAGIGRGEAYVTNAVKHFKYEPVGTQRIHQKPARAEIIACKGWLMAEVKQVQPRVIICLGASAAQSFMGHAFKLTVNRGQRFQTPFAEHWLATYHPSALLRADPLRSERMRQALVEDLTRARSLLIA